MTRLINYLWQILTALLAAFLALSLWKNNKTEKEKLKSEAKEATNEINRLRSEKEALLVNQKEADKTQALINEAISEPTSVTEESPKKQGIITIGLIFLSFTLAGCSARTVIEYVPVSTTVPRIPNLYPYELPTTDLEPYNGSNNYCTDFDGAMRIKKRMQEKDSVIYRLNKAIDYQNLYLDNVTEFK